MLLRSLSGKYPWERYEPAYPPCYGLNSTTTILLGEWIMALNNLQRVDMPLNKETKPNQTKNKQKNLMIQLNKKCKYEHTKNEIP